MNGPPLTQTPRTPTGVEIVGSVSNGVVLVENGTRMGETKFVDDEKGFNWGDEVEE